MQPECWGKSKYPCICPRPKLPLAPGRRDAEKTEERRQAVSRIQTKPWRSTVGVHHSGMEVSRDFSGIIMDAQWHSKLFNKSKNIGSSNITQKMSSCPRLTHETHLSHCRQVGISVVDTSLARTEQGTLPQPMLSHPPSAVSWPHNPGWWVQPASWRALRGQHPAGRTALVLTSPCSACPPVQSIQHAALRTAWEVTCFNLQRWIPALKPYWFLSTSRENKATKLGAQQPFSL